MKRPAFNLALLLFFTYFVGTVSAQIPLDAFRLSDIGLGSSARALGMGNAYQSLSDDYSAASFNPAGFGLLKRMEFAGGLNYSKQNNSTTFFGNTTPYSNSATNLNQLSFAFPFPTIRGSLVFAVGYNRDRDFNGAVSFNGFNPNSSMIYSNAIQSNNERDELLYELGLIDKNGNTPIQGNVNQEGTILSKGGIGRWSFSGAIEVARNMFLGATLNIITGSFNNARDYYETDTRNVYGANVLTDPADSTTADFREYYFNDVLDWDLSGWDAKIGFIYQLSPMARVGASIKFPTSYTIKETYTVNGKSTFANATYLPYQDFQNVSTSEYDISSPYQFSGGASVNLKGLILSGDATYIDFTQMEFKSGLDAGVISSNNKDIKTTYRGVLNYNLGAEYTIPQANLRLRGGFIMNPSPYEGDPSERNRKYVTGGIGFLADEAFAFDVAYAYGWWKDIGENYGYNESVTYQDVRNHNVILSVSFRF
ncbi:MAG: OmpP1/FadL family transporter [Acidobacteriota bacterium]